MKKVQMNLQVAENIRDWIYSEAAKDDRKPAYFLSRLVEPMMAENTVTVKACVNASVKSLPAKRINVDKERGFDEFWYVYPKKKAKQDARKSWVKNSCHLLLGRILADIEDRALHDPSWQEKQYIPNGATYLNGKRWEDEVYQEDNRPKFEKNNDSLRKELFGNKDKGEIYEH